MDPAAFGYIRVSQAEGESGLATQRRTLNDQGLRDDRIFTDVASGKNMRRHSWQELRGMLKPRDTVVVPRIDRLARNLTEGLKTIEELHGQGINIRSLAEGLDTGDDTRRPSCPSVDSQGGILTPATTAPPQIPPHAPYAALPGGVGEGHHQGPDQGRSGPRRGRGEDWGKASGAVFREGGGRQGFPGERWDGKRRGQDLRGEPAHRAVREGRDLRGPRRTYVAPERQLNYHPGMVFWLTN